MLTVDAPSVSSLSARDRLIRAAVELFATRGFQAIGLRDLAGCAGLQAGSLYYHIENKQSLLFELIESALSDLLVITRRRLNGARTHSEKIHRFVQAFVSFALNEKYRLALITREFISLTEEHKQHADQLKNNHSKLLYNIIADKHGVKNSSDEKTCLITNAIIGMLYGQSQWDMGNISEQHLADLLSECVLRMIASDKE
ncbi:TetR/AcrR family transcriptional regulator [Pseudomonas sp. X10]